MQNTEKKSISSTRKIWMSFKNNYISILFSPQILFIYSIESNLKQRILFDFHSSIVSYKCQCKYSTIVYNWDLRIEIDQLISSQFIIDWKSNNLFKCKQFKATTIHWKVESNCESVKLNFWSQR